MTFTEQRQYKFYSNNGNYYLENVKSQVYLQIMAQKKATTYELKCSIIVCSLRDRVFPYFLSLDLSNGNKSVTRSGDVANFATQIDFLRMLSQIMINWRNCRRAA